MESGFFGPGDVCDDIIECALNPGICPTGALCTNTIGSFICSCETGYHVISDACVDINECLDGQGNWFKLDHSRFECMKTEFEPTLNPKSTLSDKFCMPKHSRFFSMRLY